MLKSSGFSSSLRWKKMSSLSLKMFAIASRIVSIIWLILASSITDYSDVVLSSLCICSIRPFSRIFGKCGFEKQPKKSFEKPPKTFEKTPKTFEKPPKTFKKPPKTFEKPTKTFEKATKIPIFFCKGG